MGMELKQLRYFVGVSEAGSLLKASGRLHIAQPALGQHMAVLESELGARLFERSSRGVTLTEAGKVFLAHARVVLADAERAKLAVRDMASIPRGEVALGLPTTVALGSTLPILSACRAQFPEVRLKVVEAYSGFLKEWLLAGRLDLALLFGNTAELGLTKRPLLEDRIVFVTSVSARPLAPSMSLAALADEPLVLPGKEHGLRRIVEDACAPLELRLKVVAEIESLSSVKRATEAGIGSTILPLASVTEEVTAGRLRTAAIDSEFMSRRVVVATHTQRPVSNASAAVNALVVRTLHGMVANGTWPAKWVAKDDREPRPV
jgi:LysR family transcriptional regulator, nitrogen assimilation regulatory protein